MYSKLANYTVKSIGPLEKKNVQICSKRGTFGEKEREREKRHRERERGSERERVIKKERERKGEREKAIKRGEKIFLEITVFC